MKTDKRLNKSVSSAPKLRSMSTKLITKSNKLRKQAASTESNISVEKRFSKLIQAKKLEA